MVGVGSSREAYACFGGRCLKLAINDAGVDQNRQEMENTGPGIFSGDWDCFAQSYTISKDGCLLLTECCSKHEGEKHLANLLGVQQWLTWEAVMHALTLAGDKLDVAKAADLAADDAEDLQLKRMEEYALAAEDASNLLRNLADGRTTKLSQTALELFDFWRKNGLSGLMPADLASPENWGCAIRDGEIEPVVIDTGFSKDVADRHYKA